MKQLYNDDKHPKVLRVAMRYHLARALVETDTPVDVDVAEFRAFLDNFSDVFGHNSEATIECMYTYVQALLELVHEGHIEIFHTAYDKAVSNPTSSHFLVARI